MSEEGQKDTNEGQLLFISDLEGCVPNWTPDGTLKPLPKLTKQNVSLCEKGTYDNDGPLCKFLSNNKNKIAFLGDYFDKGPGVEQSIIGIAKLKNEFGDRVHIILGNRDINKLRLFYELKNDEIFEQNSGWQLWIDKFKKNNENTPSFFESFLELKNKNNSTLTELIDVILVKSMGADGIEPYWADDEAKKTKQLGYIDNLINIFTAFNEENAFHVAVRTIFKKGKIVEYDQNFNVLMSHAGGFDNIVFKGYAERIDGIRTSLKTENSYFDKMEIARKGLENEVEGVVIDDITNLSSSFKLSNKILKNVVDTIFPQPEGKEDATQLEKEETDPNDFFILQASGLKPAKGHGDNSQIFASFIQSCGSGCGQPPASKYLIEPFAPKIKYESNDIKFIAHGHVPHCLPFPLIVNNNDTIFIHNDTSNGQKQTENVGEAITTLPFAYLELGTNPQIGILKEGRMAPYSETNKFFSVNKNFNNLIIEMNEKGPIHANIIENRIKWDGYKPATVEAGTEAAPQAGGKTRRRRKNRSRNLKKASSKRRRRRNRSRKRK